MLSRRLQLPQSLARQRQWRSLWQLHPGFQSRSISQSQPSPATPRKTTNSWKPKQKGEPASSPLRRSPQLSNKKASKLGSKNHTAPGRSVGGTNKISRGRTGTSQSSELTKGLRSLEVQGLLSKTKVGNASSDILSEFSSWIDGPPTAQDLPDDKNTGGDARVLVLQSASRFLVESDFYRLASQGRHVDGWVHGLSRVIQARSPVTLQPQGKFFLFFDKPASAQAYLQNVLELHAKVRRLAVKDPVESETGASSHEISPEDEKTEVERTEPDDMDVPTLLKTYTLLPPGASLKIQRQSEGKIRDMLLKEHNQSRRARRVKSPSKDQPTPELQNETHSVEKHVDKLGLPMEQNQVLVKLSRSKLTIYGLRWAIDTDSKRRNLPWRLQIPTPPSSSPSSSSSASSPIQPLEYSKQMVKYSQYNSSPAHGGTDKNNWPDYYSHGPQDVVDEDANLSYETNSPPTPAEDDAYNSWKYPNQSWGEEGAMWSEQDLSSSPEWKNQGVPGKIDAKHQGFGSFVVSLADVHEARRFAREWHRHRIWDHRTGRWITVDATWLW